MPFRVTGADGRLIGVYPTIDEVHELERRLNLNVDLAASSPESLQIQQVDAFGVPVGGVASYTDAG